MEVKRRGRPTLLPADVMAKTISMVKCLRVKGAPVSSSVITAIARGMIKACDSSLLAENGGSLILNTDWARQVLYRMETNGEKLVRRMATTAKIPVSPALIAEIKLDYQRKYQRLQKWHNIPKDLIVNFDQTPLPYICASKHTLELRGAKSVPLVGKGKTKQITGTFAISQSGVFLPIQLIYEGKTTRCLPKIDFPEGFNVTFTKNHWSNEEKAIEFLKEIVFPYLKSEKERLNLPADQKSLLIYDVFRGQTTEKVTKIIEENDCVILYVPANMTNFFQMLDLNVNGYAKEFLKKKFELWYSEKVQNQLEAGKDIYDVTVSMKLSDLKPKQAQWIIGLYDQLRNSKEMILKSWEMAGLEEAFYMNLPPEDPFADLD